MLRHLVVATLLILTCGSTGLAANPSPADAVLERFVEAVGGRASLEATDVRHYRGRIVQDLTWKDPQHTEVPFVAEANAEGRVRYTESTEWEDLPDLDTNEFVCFGIARPVWIRVDVVHDA